MVQPLVSVIITNYNYEDFILHAIDSALVQTYENIEVIIVDDGSSDNSRMIISDYARKDSRVCPIFQSNSGQAAATNVGILASKGEFVAFLDADDIWYPDKLKKQLPLFEDSSVGVVYSSASIIDLSGNPYDEMITKRIDKAENFLNSIILDNFIPFTSAVVRKQFFAKAGMLNAQYRVCTDYDLWLRLAKFCRFDCILEQLVGYRAKPGSLSGNPVEMFKVSREITDIFFRQNSSLFDKKFIRNERAVSYSRRVYSFSQQFYVLDALKSMLMLIFVNPFNLNIFKSIFHVLRMLLKYPFK